MTPPGKKTSSAHATEELFDCVDSSTESVLAEDSIPDTSASSSSSDTLNTPCGSSVSESVADDEVDEVDDLSLLFDEPPSEDEELIEVTPQGVRRYDPKIVVKLYEACKQQIDDGKSVSMEAFKRVLSSAEIKDTTSDSELFDAVREDLRLEDAQLADKLDSKISSGDIKGYLNALSEETAISIDERIEEVSKSKWYPSWYLDYLKQKKSVSERTSIGDEMPRNRSAP